MKLSRRPQSARKKDTLITPKEEVLIKKIKTLEEQLEDFVQREKKWKETRRSKVSYLSNTYHDSL